MAEDREARSTASSLGDIRATALDTLWALATETDPLMQAFWLHGEQRITMGRDTLVAVLAEVEALGCTPEVLPLIRSASHGVSGLYEDMQK